MKEGSAQLLLVRKLFTVLLVKLREHAENLEHRDEKTFTNLRFQVDQYCWFFTHHNDVIDMEEIFFDRVGDKPIDSICSLTTDAATMLKVCRGDMSFPSAYLSGKVKFHGDKKVMKAIAVPIKDAIDVLKGLKMDTESPDVSNYSESPSQVSTDDHSQLTARIVEAFAPNFKYNIEDKSTNRTNQTVSKDVAVRYKIEITNISTGEVWSVAHRYSHFLNLRSELVEQGFRNIPTISSKNSYFNSIGRVVHSRIINLGFFINECLTQVGCDNETLNQFLAKPVNQHSHGDNHSVSGSVAQSTQDTDLSSFLHSNLHTELHHNHDNKEAKNISKAELEALEHAWGSRITWSHSNLHHSRYLIKELAAQRAAVEKVHQQSSHHASNLINRIVLSVRTYSLVLVCVLISAYYYEYSHMEPNHAANVYVDTLAKLTLLLLLYFKQTRYLTLLYCVLFLVVINTTFISVTMVNTVVNKYSEHWTMYKSHIKWLSIPHSVVMVPEAYTYPPSVSLIVRNTLPTTLYEVVVGSTLVVYAAAKSVLYSTVDLSRVYSFMMEVIFTPGVVCTANLVKAVQGVDAVICCMLAVYSLLVYVLSSAGITRALWIYALGTFLIGIYATLQIVSIVLRLSPSVSEHLFAQFDAIVAPFVVTQIGLLKSVFVKFAQYFGGRSDVVSAVWTELLCRLQDSCPASSPEYVRRTIETQLGEIFSVQDNGETVGAGAGNGKPFKLEDVFDSFEVTPIASASIGQVHTATLKHAALMRILHLQQRTNQRNTADHMSTGTNVGAEALQSEVIRGRDGIASGSVQTDAPSGVYSIGTAQTAESGGPVSPQHAPSILTPSSTPVAAMAPHTADTITTMTSNNNSTQHSASVDAATANHTAPPSATTDTIPPSTATPTKPIPVPVDHSWYECVTDPTFTSASRASESELVSVVVKVQHEDVDRLMVADMKIVLVLVKWASFFDSRWETMLQVMRSWDLTMRGELDYQQEANNLREMKDIMGRSNLGAATPYPVPGLVSQKVLVMTRLFGHKVTDQTALMLHNVDREALLCRLAHCSAYQLLVAGVFNADPHAGNILFCLSTKSTPSFATPHVEPDAEQDSHYRLSTAARPATTTANGSRTHTPAVDRSQHKAGRVIGSATHSSQHKPGNGNSVTFQRHRANSELSDTSSDEESVVSVLSNTAPSLASTNSYARHIYDATPGKGIGYHARPSAANHSNGSVTGSVTGSVAGSANGSTATYGTKNASINTQVSDTHSEHTVRRMIYDATPARGVGFATELSTMHSPAAVFSPAASSLAPTPSVAAGHTPFPRGAPPLTPHNSSASLLRRRFSNSSMNHDTSFTTQQHEEDASMAPDIIPGLLDFGMTVRLSPERRRTYCRLIIALCEGDMKAAAAELRTVGYSSNQSDRAPERDAEFFEHLFRDANPRGISKQERDDFNARRSQQKADDIANGTREKGGRSIATVPDDFLFLTRLVGLLRGLTAELDATCPILYILSLNARIGLQHED